MGKDRKKRHKPPKQQPTGLPSVKDFVEAEETRNGTCSYVSEDCSGVLTEVLEKLQSACVDDREIGCSILVGLVTQPQAVNLLLKNNIIKILAPLIVDPSPDVRCRSLGALRNFSVDGGHDVCEEMIQKDVMTPLVALFQKYGRKWNPDEETKSTDTAVDIYIEAVHLLWNLCESSDLAVKVFNKENLLSCLLPCLDYCIYTYPLAIAVAHCLHTVAEDNKQVADICKQPEVLSSLHKLAVMSCDTTESYLLRTLVTGIIVNIYGNEITSVDASIVSAIIKSAAAVLNMNIMDKISEYLDKQKCDGDKVNKATPMEGDEATSMEDNEPLLTNDLSKLPNPLDEESKALKDIDDMLIAQRLSSEIVANLCCSDDDEYEEIHESSSTEDVCNIDEQMTETSAPLCLSSEIHSEFVSLDLFSKLLNKAECLDENKKICLQESSSGKKVVRSYIQVQIHSLLSAHNMVNAMEAKDLGGLNKLENVWDGLATLSTSKQATEDKNYLEAVTSCMRAVIHKLAELKSRKFSETSSSDMQRLCNIGQNSSSSIKVNVIRIICTVGCILASNPRPHPLLKDIGLYLVDNCKTDELWVVAEALDSIFDVFGEDHIDSIVKEIDLIQKLRTILPPLKAKINSQKKKLGDKYSLITTARTNLIRFIRYKS